MGSRHSERGTSAALRLPTEGVQKAFVVRYSCGTDTTVRQVSLAAEAQGSTVTLNWQ